VSAGQDGGAAFPTQIGMRQTGQYETEFDTLPGMSLRDWFAGQALIGTLANSEGVHAATEPTNAILSGDRRSSFARFLATQAYDIADAMLAARAAAPPAREEKP